MAQEGTKSSLWRPGQDVAHIRGSGEKVWREDVLNVIEETITGLDAALRQLSLSIHGMSIQSSMRHTPTHNDRAPRTSFRRAVSGRDAAVHI